MSKSFSYLKNFAKRVLTPLFPHAIVYNRSTEPIIIIVDPQEEHHPEHKHSIVVLMPGTSTLDIDILDPEAVIHPKHLFRSPEGYIWAHRFIPIVKTPSGFEVDITHQENTVMGFRFVARGFRGRLAQQVVCPSLKDTNCFSKGYFVRPYPHSPLCAPYDALAHSLPLSNRPNRRISS